MAKYIFVTGGVVSSLGKGISAASLGMLLKRRGLKVFMIKFDPYLNVDPGTMSPYQHGEVYVTDKNGELLLRLHGKCGSHTLKVGLLSKTAGHCNSFKAVEDKVKCQITKYQMCMGCLGCESVCAKGAINILTDHSGLLSYKISNEKCVRCGACIGHFDGGCYMRKVMTIKRS